MKKDILEFCKQCLVCQKVKPKRVKILGKLQPLDIPQMKWECISMDFITALPKVAGSFDSICSSQSTNKGSSFNTYSNYCFSIKYPQLFVKEIVRLHGVLARIISDRDAKFTSKFWTAMFQSLGTLLNLSAAYHLEIDGQIERVN